MNLDSIGESAGVLTIAAGQIHDPQKEMRCVPLLGTERQG
jgi:hypothetical protein